MVSQKDSKNSLNKKESLENNMPRGPKRKSLRRRRNPRTRSKWWRW